MGSPLQHPLPAPFAAQGDPRRLIHFRTDQVELPLSLYIGTDDFLYWQTWSSVANNPITLSIRYLAPDGQIIPQLEVITPTSDRLVNNKSIRLQEGFILSVSLLGLGSERPGQVYSRLTLARQAVPGTFYTAALLFAGYVSPYDVLAWPFGHNIAPTDNRGNLRSITGTLPAAGAEISESVPTGVRWRILAFRYSLTSSVAVANRDSQLTIDDGANIFVQESAEAPQAASLAWRYTWAPGLVIGAQSNATVFVPLPVGLELNAGSRIRTATQNLQAADQYSAPQYFVEEFLSV